MKSLRFIALKLAALSEKDRRWLLGQLPQVERDHLRPELDRALMLSTEELLKALDESGSGDMLGDEGATNAHAGLNEASVEQLTTILGPLPLACTALLLDKGPWASSEGIEASLTADERRNLSKALAALRSRISPRFEDLMLDRFSKAAIKPANGTGGGRLSPFETILDA